MTAHWYQQGAASLLITLVLVMTTSLITLTVARTQLDEQRIAGNDSWHTRLFLHAEAGMARGLGRLARDFDSMDWLLDTGSNTFINHTAIDSGQPAVTSELVFSHAAGTDRYIKVQSLARRNDGSAIQASISQQVRLLSVLTPAAESAPPLVVNGCLLPMPPGLEIRPLKADTDQAGEAAWFNSATPCPALESIDRHNGALAGKNMPDDLWRLIFSVSREEFLALVILSRVRPKDIYRLQERVAAELSRWASKERFNFGYSGGLSLPMMLSSVSSDGAGSSYGAGEGQTVVDGESHVVGRAHTEGVTHGEAWGEAHTRGHSHVVSVARGHSVGYAEGVSHGRAESHGVADTVSHVEGHGVADTASHVESHGVADSVSHVESHSIARGRSGSEFTGGAIRSSGGRRS